MIAYHGDAALKRKTMAKVAAHRKADQLVRGVGASGTGTNFRGCAVGCTIGTYSHAAYETKLGVPQILARLEDQIFESLPQDEAMLWPTQFLGAIRTGADLSLVWSRFALWLLEDELKKHAKVTEPVAALYRRQVSGDAPSRDEWIKARNESWRVRQALYAAADAAADAAYANAADAANAYAAAANAADAADAAADAAAYAADAANAYAAAANAAAADAADAYAAADADAADADRKAYWLRASAKLLELLKAAPVTRKRSRK